jgi:hypothetical protein
VAEHYPRAAIHVMILEEMVDAPEAVLSELHRFLGVEEAFTPPNLGEVFNASHSFRSWRLRKAMMRVRAWSIAPGLARRLDRLNRDEAAYPEMEPDVRARLEEHFAAPNRELASWLGREITAWSN